MISFKAILKKDITHGEKSGWTYIEIPRKVANELKPNNKKSFRVNGTLDGKKISSAALLPVGEGNFIMAINAAMRKLSGKRQGDAVQVVLEEDKKGKTLHPELMQCLNDDTEAHTFFKTLSPGHQHYFSSYVEAAKTETTKTKRIAQILNAMILKMDYGQMIRHAKAEKAKLL